MCFNKARTDSWPLTHYRDVVSCVIKLDTSILEGILEPPIEPLRSPTSPLIDPYA